MKTRGHWELEKKEGLNIGTKIRFSIKYKNKIARQIWNEEMMNIYSGTFVNDCKCTSPQRVTATNTEKDVAGRRGCDPGGDTGCCGHTS